VSIFGRFLCVAVCRWLPRHHNIWIWPQTPTPPTSQKGRHWRGGWGGRHLVRCSHFYFFCFSAVCVAHHGLFLKFLFAKTKTKCHRNRNETLVLLCFMGLPVCGCCETHLSRALPLIIREIYRRPSQLNQIQASLYNPNMSNYTITVLPYKSNFHLYNSSQLVQRIFSLCHHKS